MIALVVTIVIMIILATIGLNMIIGEGGLIDKSSEAKEKYTIEKIKEQLEMMKVPAGIDVETGRKLNIDTYLEEAKKEKEEQKITKIEKINDKQAEIEVENKYKFLVTETEDGDIKIEYKGEGGQLTLSEVGGEITYPTEKRITVTNNESGGELSASSSDPNIADVRIEGNEVIITPKEITEDGRKVTITVKSGETDKYGEQTATYEAIVNRGSITIEADVYTGSYDGTSHDALTNIIVNPTDAKLSYAIEGGEYGPDIPKVTGETTYIVLIRAERAGYVTKEITRTVVVGKAEVHVSLKGNTLCFSNSKTIAEAGATTYYGNVQDQEYGRVKWGEVATPWWKDRANITAAKFETKVYPTNMINWFAWLTNLTKIDNIGNLDTSKVTSMYGTFWSCKNLESLDVSKFDTSKVTNMNAMFASCAKLSQLDVSKFDTSKVTDMNSMFTSCTQLASIDVSNFKTSKVTDMGFMFQSLGNLTSLNVSKFDTNQVTSMREMFSGCTKIATLDVSHFDTSQVNSMQCMFLNCSSLTTLDVSQFDTSQVTDMDKMFSHCEKVTSLNVSNFNTSQVTNMEGMFANCTALTTLNVSHFDTKNVTNMAYMFQYCSGLTNLDLSNFNTSNVTNMMFMFEHCNNLQSLNIAKFDTSKVTEKASILDYVDWPTKIITNQKTKEWIDALYYNQYTNIVVVNI